ncbi:MAG: hypothetical protein ACM3S2_02445 [Ignavibacteriales bacterium]
MNDIEKKKMGMYEAVLGLLAENKDITSGIRSFSSNIIKLRKVMDEIRRKEKELSSEILEKTIINANRKDDLLVALVPVTSALFNFARQTNNVELREKTRLTQSHFIRLLDAELTNKAEAIRILALKHIVELKKFGITTNSIHNLGIKIEYFRNSLNNKIASLISSDTVMQMNNLFGDADNILTQMDKFVEMVNDEYEEFYDEYIYTRDLENQDESKELIELDEDEED